MFSVRLKLRENNKKLLEDLFFLVLNYWVYLSTRVVGFSQEQNIVLLVLLLCSYFS